MKEISDKADVFWSKIDDCCAWVNDFSGEELYEMPRVIRNQLINSIEELRAAIKCLETEFKAEVYKNDKNNNK